jgi:hypothetical protein
MTITLRDKCWNNTPNVSSRTSDITYTIAAATGSANAASVGGTNTAATTVSGCDITKTLEIYNDVTADWDDYTAASSSVKSTNYPWLSVSGGVATVSEVQTTAGVAVSDYSAVEFKEYNLRWKNIDARCELDLDECSDYDYFDVRIDWECVKNTVSIGSSAYPATAEGISDFSWTISGTASTAKALDYTELYTGCPTDVSVTCYSSNAGNAAGTDDQISSWDDNNWIVADAIHSEIETCNLATGF